MGKMILLACRSETELTVVAGVDQVAGDTDSLPVYSSFKDCIEKADVVLDFSNSVVLDSIYEYCSVNKIPAVICTTGFTEEQEKKIAQLSKIVPVFKSANMSLGVNLIANLAKTAAKLLSGSFDIEILEKHHRRKVDAPSGTAMMLANEINAACDGRYHYVYERESVRQSRGNEELGIHAIRGGTIVGEHDVIFAGTDEIVTLSHSASSRSVFATGAIAAVKFIVRQEPGFYNMNDLIGQL